MLNDKIRMYRHKAGYSLTDLARIIGVSPSTIRYWEMSEKEPGLHKAVLLAKALNVKIEDLLDSGEMLLKEKELRKITIMKQIEQLKKEMDAL